MPLRLRIRASHEVQAREVEFSQFPITLGRDLSADVILDDESVTLRHAIIEQRGEDFSLHDLESTNGSFVGGIRVSAPRLLLDGDIAKVGIFWIQFEYEEAISEDVETAKLARQMVSKFLQKGAPTHAIRVVEGQKIGAWLILAESERPYWLGRDETCDLCLTDDFISRRHVQLTRRGDQVFLRDGGSKNGTVLGDLPLPADLESRWKPMAHVRVGAAVIALAEPRPTLDEFLERALRSERPFKASLMPSPAMVEGGAESIASSRRPGEQRNDAPVAQVPASVIPSSPRARTRPRWIRFAFYGSLVLLFGICFVTVYWVLTAS